MDLIRSTGHSRIPVYGRSPDDIVGIIDGRDVFLNPGRPLEEMLRKAYFVPESKTVESLLHEFRTLKRTAVVVVDEYGGTAGLVTLEDVVETIVGEIHDEYDLPELAARMCGENCYLLSGRLSVSEWAEMFGIVVEDRRPATLGGLVLMLLGHLPKEGEQVRYGNLRFTITRVSRHSVEEVMVEYAEPPEGQEVKP
jgi:CBS domain containing-hemolysin-like protein